MTGAIDVVQEDATGDDSLPPLSGAALPSHTGLVSSGKKVSFKIISTFFFLLIINFYLLTFQVAELHELMPPQWPNTILWSRWTALV